MGGFNLLGVLGDPDTEHPDITGFGMFKKTGTAGKKIQKTVPSVCAIVTKYKVAPDL